MTNSLRLQDSGDRRHLPAPFWCLAPELPPSLLGQNVILGPPVILCSSPFATDQFSSLQPLEGNKQGTALTRNTSLPICSMRTATPYPCMGSGSSVFRISISSVPCTRSLDLSAINPLPLRIKRKDTLLPLTVKRR